MTGIYNPFLSVVGPVLYPRAMPLSPSEVMICALVDRLSDQTLRETNSDRKDLRKTNHPNYRHRKTLLHGILT